MKNYKNIYEIQKDLEKLEERKKQILLKEKEKSNIYFSLVSKINDVLTEQRENNKDDFIDRADNIVTELLDLLFQYDDILEEYRIIKDNE